MRLLKSFLLGTIASSVLGQDTPVCPEGWAIGQNKCYKENISKHNNSSKYSDKGEIHSRVKIDEVPIKVRVKFGIG